MSNAHPAQIRLAEQQREYEAFLKIAQQNREFCNYLNLYSQQFAVLGHGSESIAQVVEHWQNVFRITHLALASLVAQQAPPSDDDPAPTLPSGTMPDRIVRIPAAESSNDSA